LLRNENVRIVALVDSSRQPTSSLVSKLISLSDLAEQCGDGCHTFSSVQELLHSDVASSLNGALICTPHATHYEITENIIQFGINRVVHQGGSPLHIFLEKPMTTDVEQAKSLSEMAHSYWRTCSVTTDKEGMDPYFQLNHSANFREQTRVAKELIQKGSIGSIRHINASMASPLAWLFGHPGNLGWNEPTEGMLGNGFAWGQSSHLLAWLYQVTGDEVNPQTVYCAMNHSETSGADLSHSATIRCDNDIIMNISGTCLLPGNEHGDLPVGKEIIIQIFGTDGALFYCGNDHDPSSGRLELRKGKSSGPDEEGSTQTFCSDLGFQFENTDQDGTGPESLQSFIAACLGKKNYRKAASPQVGFKSIQTLEAMYRSQHSGTVEDVAYGTKKRKGARKR